jgi:D-alanyl-D-alanine carboxypeptidase
MRSKKVFLLLIFAIVVLDVYWLIHSHNRLSPENHAIHTRHDQPKTTDKAAAQAVGFDKKLYSLTDHDSLWVIANKTRPLTPKNYTPSDLTVPKVSLRVPGDPSMQLRQPAAEATEQMLAAAQSEGVTTLRLSSAFRSYSFQVSLYNSYVKSSGQAEADRSSARPGYSEHQTGLAADFDSNTGRCHLEECFADMAEGQWLASNAYKYGFVLRYPKDQEGTTGYKYEPWHFRYVGRELAAEIHNKNNVPLETFFDLGPAPDYQ